MAGSEIHYLGDTVLRLWALGRVQGRRQVLVHIRLTEFCDDIEGISVCPAMISFRFHLGQLSFSRALPRIVSLVASHLDAENRQLCECRLLRFALEASSGRATSRSTLELFFDISTFYSPSACHAEDLELMADWMLDTPAEVEDMSDYYLEDFDGFGGVPASGSFIERLEQFPYGGGEGIREQQCIICLEDFNVGDQISRMPCSHSFHNQCIIHWLEQSHVCPICRHEMP